MKRKQKSVVNKRRIYLSYDHDRVGTVIAEGPEVSEIRFDDGTIRCIPNDHLKELKK